MAGDYPPMVNSYEFGLIASRGKESEWHFSHPLDVALYQNARVARTRSTTDGARVSGRTPPESNADVPPELLTVEEVAALLRTSRHAIYAMAERAQLPGKIKLGRRLLFRRRDLFKLLGL